MPNRSQHRPLRAVGAAALLAAGLAVGLSSCSTPPWLGPDDTAAPTTSAPQTTPAQPVQNDLAAGSATRTLEVGAVTLTVDYWSTLSMDQWTAAAQKPLSFSLRGTIAPADGQKLYLSRVTATPAVRAADGSALPGFDPIVDQSTVAPGYLILDPYSYSQTFTLPPVDQAATSIEISMRYELLQQSTPTSTDYAKQTVVDTLTIAIAAEPGDSEPGDAEAPTETTEPAE
ncbi:hypothetical protein [Agromyces sp. LHK192]|uniref:hypothetical protein n=1 Tax=Agromyces sp. LHK192 TaxID=2498704 RepID=UPI00196A69D5|nr:hypothetical protein [Agromyces sp. LHK192]